MENENERSDRALIRQRALATGLLVAAAATLAATHLTPEPSFAVQLLRAASEAALVGGLADWFAVVALFRHPFGLPIPHTAIIPNNKDRIAEGVGRFVEQHFLEPGLLVWRVRRLDPAARLGAWLATPENGSRLAARLAAAAPFFFRAAGDRQLRAFLSRTLHQHLEAANLSPPLGRLLELLTEGGRHQALFDHALILAAGQLARHEGRIYEMVAEKSHWWIPPGIDRSVARRIVAGIQDLLEEMAARDHEVRRGFDRAVADLIEKLKHSPEFHARLDAVKRELLASPLVQGYLAALWDQLRGMAVAEGTASPFREALAGAVTALGEELMRDEALRARLNGLVERWVVEAAVPWRREIGAFITEVMQGWEGATVTARIEQVIGKDLQFIRINGTLVGALVGLSLFLLSRV